MAATMPYFISVESDAILLVVRINRWEVTRPNESTRTRFASKYTISPER